jgi:8-oxo-dGTP pyrophosphatase MutT (NUDIX family)
MTIRTVALCVIRRREEILLEESYDSLVNKTFYRPIGGTVEHGENSKLTVIREVKEEIKTDITEPKLLGVIENIFAYLDQVGHEVDFIYEAEIIDKTFYTLNEIDGIEGTSPYKAVWKSLDYFKNNDKVKLVPDGLAVLLEKGFSETSIRHVSTR